jgi:hypothetical protein
VVQSLRNWVRRHLGSAPRERALPPRGPRPSVGARTVNGDFRMTVQVGMSDELWRWLMKQGWRECTYRWERRRYREVPAVYVASLIEAPADRWPALLASALERASPRTPAATKAPRANDR